MAYKDLLKHPNWQRKRLEILQRDGFKCRNCNDPDSTLHVHHFTYESNRKPWEYPNENFITLCFKCHEREEFLKAFKISGFEYLVELGFLRTDLFDIIQCISRRSDDLDFEGMRAYFERIKKLVQDA